LGTVDVCVKSASQWWNDGRDEWMDGMEGFKEFLDGLMTAMDGWAHLPFIIFS
jgi:hypothetical protein